MVRLKDFFDLHNNLARTQEHWAFYIFDDMEEQVATYNSYHRLDNIHPAILECGVKYYHMGCTSLFIFINIPIETEYLSEEVCLMDGYERIFLPYDKNRYINLYVKETTYGYTFAKIVK